MTKFLISGSAVVHEVEGMSLHTYPLSPVRIAFVHVQAVTGDVIVEVDAPEGFVISKDTHGNVWLSAIDVSTMSTILNLRKAA